ncbi:unnamed protein product [Polarella glacialis]|uniref:Reverse transcriptase domain-containing protein n=1 Tax=Polarella glacialis TaxID=89957 RepID=A0A813ENY8_POLGL|nr:unnamed protein product [Polarella glacialis]
MLSVLASWLDDRSAVVVIDNTNSEPGPLKNSVYQGTVLGPLLWNCHYEDARRASEHGFDENIFADDLNCFKVFDRRAPNDEVYAEPQSRQSSLHRWGAANQVTFDPGKESFHIIDRRAPAGADFRNLGVTFDTKLIMNTAAHEVALQAGWRLRCLLRGCRFFSRYVLVRLHKSQVFSYVEFGAPALYYAPDFYLAPVDNIQARFLEEAGISALEALTEFHLAPLSTRQDIAMMGLLRRIALGSAPPLFSSFIRRETRPLFLRCLRNQASRHDKQLQDPIDGTRTFMLERSVLGLIYTYNMLPQHRVNEKSTSGFQRKLQLAVKRLAATGEPNWPHLLRTGIKTMSATSFQSCFI